MLTEEEKEELYKKHKGIIYYIANRLRYLDEDFEELVGWATLGFVIALNKYEEYQSNLDSSDDKKSLTLPQIAFTTIRQEVHRAYRRRPSQSSLISLNQHVGEGEDEFGSILEADSVMAYSDADILCMMERALFSLDNVDRELVIEYYMRNDSIEELASTYRKKKRDITRLIRRSQALIKKYLVDNDIVNQENVNICIPEKPKKSFYTDKPLEKEHYGKMKFILKAYPYFTKDDIANYLGVSSFLLMDMIGYPSSDYRTAGIDDSIKDDVRAYAQLLYPEYIPGEVKVIQSRECMTI